MSTPRTVRYAVEEFSISAQLFSESMIAFQNVKEDLLAECEELIKKSAGCSISFRETPEQMARGKAALLVFTKAAEAIENSIGICFVGSNALDPNLKEVIKRLPDATANCVLENLEIKRKTSDLLKAVEGDFAQKPELRTPSLLQKIEAVVCSINELEEAAFSFQKSVKKLSELVTWHLPEDPDSGEAWKNAPAD